MSDSAVEPFVDRFAEGSAPLLKHPSGRQPFTDLPGVERGVMRAHCARQLMLCHLSGKSCLSHLPAKLVVRILLREFFGAVARLSPRCVLIIRSTGDVSVLTEIDAESVGDPPECLRPRFWRICLIVINIVVFSLSRQSERTAC